MFRRRIGPSPREAGFICAGSGGCPDILELDTGNFAVIGTDITEQAASLLPTDSGCAPAERIIEIPRSTLIGARAFIPEL